MGFWVNDALIGFLIDLMLHCNSTHCSLKTLSTSNGGSTYLNMYMYVCLELQWIESPIGSAFRLETLVQQQQK